MPAIINTALCDGCGACVEVCPCEAIVIINGVAVVADEDCPECNACYQACPRCGIQLASMLENS